MKTLPVLLLAASFLLGSCGKDEVPVEEDLFEGGYRLSEVIEEFDPEDPMLADSAFLAPETFVITATDFFDPSTGELVSAYSFINESDETFIGLSVDTNSSGDVLVGVKGCPNIDDLSGVSVTLNPDGQYRLNMLNCIGREVLADYVKFVEME